MPLLAHILPVGLVSLALSEQIARAHPQIMHTIEQSMGPRIYDGSGLVQYLGEAGYANAQAPKHGWDAQGDPSAYSGKGKGKQDAKPAKKEEKLNCEFFHSPRIFQVKFARFVTKIFEKVLVSSE